ncbi:DUF2972 domain-containing protein [Campylobacter sp. IFREMER_LSEM_CL1846]|uniref:DUF2972 domain-containing protein n=1 Tax=Campylobacter sp. IFREMER_LSEM_CL1846 TaxID=2911614 RepID=UPI0021E6B9AC|nr:DUF2972 domain-containing protein [Campylobacter sp. IFREMER_LSEM_CL1846]HEC1769108.1 DUF2972 domain-containing protein [Campylobacter lari]MCV3434385.1 DUF2972 domain-containing protein [Campylobacter sp. IFREMER_LSEM_CL1846]HEC1789687.1 DUF2972 domain-containing protein [Campylobacter lari]HEC1795904.1 DUF2972 domain-containing protein [Campylobacter lari]HEC1798341.1 DUF2972 domain-containing protein [Campylobacter lari]
MNIFSAKDRVKNHLAYKLGFAIIQHKKNKKLISLPYKLYSIKKRHIKEKKIYNDIVNVFPYMRYPLLEQCKDYNESVLYQFHLSYMLGQAYIRAHNNWHKGGYINFLFEYKKIYSKYQKIQQILNILPKELHSKLLMSNNLLIVGDLLVDIHSYSPMLQMIIKNFDFFLQHFDLIHEWINSDYFYEKYKYKNHPYPPLVDFRKNSFCFSVDQMWDLNIPLPNKFQFIYLYRHGSGAQNTMWYFRNSGLYFIDCFRWGEGKDRYCKMYSILNNINSNCVIGMSDIEYKNVEEMEKFIFLLRQDDMYILTQTRDPIDLIKHVCSRSRRYTKEQLNLIKKNVFTINDLFDDVYQEDLQENYNKNIVIMRFPTIFSHYKHLEILQDSIKKIYYIDFSDIKSDKIINIMNEFFSELKLTPLSISKAREVFAVNRYKGSLNLLFPVTLKIHLDSNKTKTIAIKFIENFFLPQNIDDFDDFYKIIFGCTHPSFGVYIHKNELLFLRQNGILYDKVLEYLKLFLCKLLSRIDNEEKYKISIENVLNELKQNQDKRNKLKCILHEELSFCKKHRPDIVTSWKYYQEFERMCKELDGD